MQQAPRLSDDSNGRLMTGENDISKETVFELPVNGTLDLHLFDPREVKDLIPAYLEECRRLGIVDLRLIHGKGKGILARTVHSILKKHPEVESFRLGESWGVTVVHLQKTESDAIRSDFS